MENGSLHPSIYVKIQGQPFSFINNFHKSQASSKGVCSVHAYANGVSHRLFGPACQRSASSTVTPTSPVFMGAPSEKGNDISLQIHASIVWFASTMAIAPIKRVIRDPLNNCIIGSLSNYENKDGYKKWIAANFLAVTAYKFLVYPLEYAQTRLANDISTCSKVEKRQFNGIIDVFRKTLKSDSIVGLYRGYNITLYEIFPKECTNNPEAGPMAKYALNIICTKLPTYPMDTMRRRMMMRSGEAVKYKNCWNAFSQILKTEGAKSRYKGAGAEVLGMPLYIGVSWLHLEFH
ncbi:hypothetical protein Ddye_023914 [Dipteronia dyeriana]|uniref:ADP/ATP translocase n=1 Tax=Dipteronia dyeriana TaxID=168575 RepID=A0AAD9WT33_9ROSI|nr:hypothetical protein Ddye_023914 [Dipteronia dyeriana]